MAGFEAALSYSVSGSNSNATGFSQGYVFGLAGSTPSALDVDLLPLPQLLAPAHPSQVATANDLPLSFTVPPTPSGLAGYDEVALTGFKLGTGFPLTGTTVAWSLYAPEGTTSVVLPSVADQILEDDTLYTLSIGSFRTDGPIDYDDYFATASFICPPLATASFPARTAASFSNYTLELGNAP